MRAPRNPSVFTRWCNGAGCRCTIIAESKSKARVPKRPGIARLAGGGLRIRVDGRRTGRYTIPNLKNMAAYRWKRITMPEGSIERELLAVLRGSRGSFYCAPQRGLAENKRDSMQHLLETKDYI